MFADLDNMISRDAAQRLKSSPQGSVLGALNSLFSPHPVTGAPSPQASAQSGLLGKMISGQGGGGSPAGAAGNAGRNTSSTNAVRDILTGPQSGNISTTDQIKQVLTGATPGNVSTEDVIKRVMTGAAPGNISTTDTVKEKIDPASKDQVVKDSADTGDKSGASFASMFTSHIAGTVRLVPARTRRSTGSRPAAPAWARACSAASARASSGSPPRRCSTSSCL